MISDTLHATTFSLLFNIMFHIMFYFLTINSDCMLHFLSVVHIVTVMHFSLLFLNLVFSFACMFFCSLYRVAQKK